MKLCKCGCGTEISEYRTWVRGHNIPSEEAKEGMRQAKLGKNFAPGYSESEVTREKKRIAATGRIFTDKARTKLRVLGVARSSKGSLGDLILQGLLDPTTCSECGLRDVWEKKPLTMHLHHVNGERKDNRAENLCYLCPNCHSQQEIHRVKASAGQNRFETKEKRVRA